MVVFAVWEPILPTDWSAPGTSVLQRLNDIRARQFWDPNHMLSAAIKQSEAVGQLHPDCCTRKGFFWDLIATYAPGSQWGDRLPEPILLNGTVVSNSMAVEAILQNSAKR